MKQNTTYTRNIKDKQKKMCQLTKQTTHGFGKPFMTSSQKMDGSYSSSPGAHTGPTEDTCTQSSYQHHSINLFANFQETT